MSNNWYSPDSVRRRNGRSMLFQERYRCYSVSFIGRSQLENGDKIIMPASALHQLASMEIEYPMLFELSTSNRLSHCGVLEFVADEGMVYMPEWMMKNMELEDGDIAMVKNVGLPKGSYIKFQPHTVDFLDVTDVKAVLENSLRKFTCLTNGDTFMVSYNERKYYINVVETRPGNAVSVVETDCEVDFAPPLDYKEPEPESEPVVEDVIEEKVGFRSFTGTGRRLDGKVVEVPVLSDEKKAGSSKSESGGGVRRQEAAKGKVVFGGKKSNGKDVEKETEKVKEEPKFKAFSGKANSLI